MIARDAPRPLSRPRERDGPHNLYLYATIVPAPAASSPEPTHPHPDVNSAARDPFRRQPHRARGCARRHGARAGGGAPPAGWRARARAARDAIAAAVAPPARRRRRPVARRKPERPSRRQRPPVPPRAAARGATGPAGVGAVAAQAAEESMKRPSTTGASTEWPRGLAKTLKNDGRDSPRIQSSRGNGKKSADGNAAEAARRAAADPSRRRRARAAARLSGFDQSANAGGRRGGAQGASDRRLSVSAAATPAVKGERPAGPLTNFVPRRRTARTPRSRARARSATAKSPSA